MAQTEGDLLTPDSTVEAFEVASTGKIHLRHERPWGTGIDCTDRFVLGTAISTQVRNVDCKKCQPLPEASDG